MNRMNPQKALASLGSQLGALNLDEARNAVAEAQKVLSALREQQKDAERSVAAAAKEVSKAKAASDGDAKEDQYSNKSFWDVRYEKERGSGLYEWYLSWEEWRQSLLGQLIHQTSGDALLVSGCGNSSLCEDLAHAGFHNVAGFDYSSVVVDAMTKRSIEKGLAERVRYFTADARNLLNVEDNSINSVVDKGTLDAIASGNASSSSGKGGGDSSQAGAVDAMTYMIEVWRILRPGGRFVVLTTMPSDVFFALAIEPLQGSGAANLCDWRNSDKITLTTGEGGKVYSYAVAKLSSPGPPHMNQVKQRRATEEIKSKGSRADVMEGINALLEEARQAKIEMDAASAKCAARSSEARAALSALNAAEAEQDKLKTRLSQQQQDLAGQLQGEKSESLLLRNVPPLADAGMSQETVAPPAPPPKVVLEVLREESNLVAGGHVVIRFELQGGAWDDSDAVQLVCVFPCKDSMHSLIEVYKAHDEQNYENLEYTTEPLAMGGTSLVGQVKISLPPSCSFYIAKYTRTSLCCRQDEKGGTVVERLTTALSQTEHFMIPSGLALGYPDSAKQIAIASPLDAAGFSLIPSPTQKVTRRRGAVPMVFDQIWTLVEDLRSIRTLSIALGLQQGETQLARLMAWARIEAGLLLLTVEIDVLNLDGSLVTRYSQARVALPPLVLVLEGAQVELDVRYQTGGSHAVVCRIPYELLAQSSETSLGKSNYGNKSDSSVVACGFCGNELVAKEKVGQILPLPSGYFDNIMNEFICSEVAPDVALCVADLTTPVGCMLVGSLHATANPCDVVPGSVTFSCKVAPSFLDLFTGNGGSIATTPLPTSLKGSRIMPLSSLVNIDTCQVLCARCGSYVGDGQLSADCPCPTPHANKQEEASSSTAQEEFVMADVRDFRFAKQCIELSAPTRDCPSDSLLLEGGITVEQGVARTLSHLSTVFAVSAFVLYVPGQTTVISLRIVSKNYAVAFIEQQCLADAIKVSFTIEELESANLNGAEARITLQHHEMQSITKFLKQRSGFYGESIYKGHVLSTLFL